MSKVNYNPSAVKSITVWEPVAVSVADELSSQLWQEHPMMRRDPNRFRHGKRWRREGIQYGSGRYDSKTERSGVFFDNKAEALDYLKETMIPKFKALVEAGVYTPCAGKTKPGFSQLRKEAGLDPERPDGDHFWNSYFDFVLAGKVDTRNSYAYRSGQFSWPKVDAFAFRAEKRTLWVPAV